MKQRNTKDIITRLEKISKMDSIKMSYILSHLEEINKKYNLNISPNEARLLKESKNMSIKNMRNPFDISASMRPK